MERLTSWNENCVLINGHALGYATKCELVQMAERLAAYEDSRLSPQACAQAAEIEKQLASYDFSAKKMLEFIRADKAGRCVVLPCKVGEKIYYLNGKYIIEADVVGYKVDETGAWLFIGETYNPETNRAYHCDLETERIGKTVFFAREEAERALQEMEGKKDGCTDTKKCN